MFCKVFSRKTFISKLESLTRKSSAVCERLQAKCKLCYHKLFQSLIFDHQFFQCYFAFVSNNHKQKFVPMYVVEQREGNVFAKTKTKTTKSVIQEHKT